MKYSLRFPQIRNVALSLATMVLLLNLKTPLMADEVERRLFASILNGQVQQNNKLSGWSVKTTNGPGLDTTLVFTKAGTLLPRDAKIWIASGKDLTAYGDQGFVKIRVVNESYISVYSINLIPDGSNIHHYKTEYMGTGIGEGYLIK